MKKKYETSPKKPVLDATPPSFDEEIKTEEIGFPVVGIGASAGGLAAFEAFFSGMPAKTSPGMAFVLVQHLAPDHKSLLTELVRKYTRMQAFEVTDGIQVNPDCVYIIPPNRDMAYANGRLTLHEVDSPHGGLRLPIDFFFHSLAENQRDRAIGIVLSGTGSDGTQGVRQIKREGGMIMAQKPETTEFDGMPYSAIATGLVDYILPPEEMAARLIAYVRQCYGKTASEDKPLPVKVESTVQAICMLLRARTGHDFSLYKKNTLIRRIERRMAVLQIESMEDYLKTVQHAPDEVEALFRDLLIGVTSFFRDPEAFEALEKLAIPRLLSAKKSGDSIRVWAPGCSTGEEAYSVAILILEQMEALNQNPRLQVFATDIDGRAVETARAGIYSSAIATDIAPSRLERYFSFDAKSDTYRVHKHLRELLIFSEQDVVKDPPFSRLDLISCRNLLIYLGPDLQKKLFKTFLYALNPNGFLFLGSSESVGEFHEHFQTLDRKSKLYLRKQEIGGYHRPLPGSYKPHLSVNTVRHGQFKSNTGEGKINLRELAERAMFQHYSTSVGVLVNERGDILYLHGRTGMYLEPPLGENGMNVLTMAREGLQPDLTTALYQALTQKKPVTRYGLRVKNNSHHTVINLTVHPAGGLDNPDAPTGLLNQELLMVIMEEVPESPQKQPEGAQPGNWKEDSVTGESDAQAQILALRQEVLAKDEYLQSAIEELEASNEELMSSNEEMQSVNEEMQSANEELETSQEELQSVNEELLTVNNELQAKVADLMRLNNDMNNLIAGTGIGTIFVDHQMRILRFTPTVTRMINLFSTDLGRPVSHILSNLVGYNQLTEDIQSVLDTLTPRELEVQVKDGGWYILRIMPYRTTENVIEGAVISFLEINERKKAEDQLSVINREMEQKLKEIQDKDHMLILQSRQVAMAEMLGNIAHQWRQPLNAVGLVMQNIGVMYRLGKLDQEKMDQFQEKGLGLIQHMSQTIDDFRNLFKPDRVKSMFSVQKTLRKICELVDPGMVGNDVELLTDYSGDYQVIGFPNEFGQVVLNLLQNAKEALKKSDAQKKWIRLSMSGNDKSVQVRVSDSGGGVPDEQCDRIFEPYYTTKADGTGIGLYLSRMIIEKNMGGTLTLRNLPEGAEFTITLKTVVPR